MKKIFFKTFGCRTNLYDTQLMKQSLKDYKICESEEEADIIVINSCTVTNSADSTVRGYINSIRKKNAYAKVILGGCGAFSKGEELYKQKKVDGVFGHSEKEKLNTLLKKESFYELGDLNSIDRSIVEKFDDKTKAFIKIQEGCDFRCSYCIIPFVRGNARSIPEDKILKEIERLALNGFGEFVLTGTNIGSYGKDIGSNIASLLKKIGSIRGVRRIRLGSLEPIQIDEEFKEILDEPWLEKHLHIALQHTDEEMLRIMHRRNNFKRDLELFEFLADKGFALGTDFIVGHPGESEERWKRGLENFKLFPLTHLHAFTYSKRDGTKSAFMKDEVRGDIAKERLKILTKIVKEKNLKFRQKQKEPLIVLIEEYKNGLFTGYDQFFNKVAVKSDQNIEKEWLKIENYEVKEDFNYARFQ
ncbi:MAG: tRNA (N(6)-L-threonylcarbamoyladenosine(37)-C(2))-methylthiotransferase MtaB [Epsilonproteobacteria bacterium]|nr:tRNA (N(6)-L-threonylcarbamoyladenosine(37)-C(2))-methylthiotransferase MtaB [Campylobacterota bacterium]